MLQQAWQCLNASEICNSIVVMNADGNTVDRFMELTETSADVRLQSNWTL